MLPFLLSLGVSSSTTSKLVWEPLLCVNDEREVLVCVMGVTPCIYVRFNLGMLGRFFADLVKERVRP